MSSIINISQVRNRDIPNLSQEQKARFVCPECTGIFRHLSKCNNCQTHYCAECINPKTRCPSCQHKTEFGIVDGDVEKKMLLDMLEIRCQKCQREFSRVDYMRHDREECESSSEESEPAGDRPVTEAVPEEPRHVHTHDQFEDKLDDY
jgi:hypothetical protein